MEDLVALVIDVSKDSFVIKNYLEELDLNVKIFTSSKESIEYIIHNHIDFILVDYDLPEIDGIELIKNIKTITDAMLIMITSNGNQELKLKALEMGVIEFINKPIIKAELLATIRNLARIKFQQAILEDEKLLIQAEVQRQISKIKKQEQEILEVLAHVAEYRDGNTFLHVKRVAEYSKILAKSMNLSDEEVELIYQAAPLHDIGKIGIKDEILLKTDKLTKQEYDIMKTHTIIGYDILKDTSSPILQMGAQIALSHHERWDGKGYPYGLKEEEISIYGRIVSIVDVFDALSASRSYKKAWNLDDVFEFLIENKGIMFDPILIDKFLNVKDEIIKYYQFSQEEIKNEDINN